MKLREKIIDWLQSKRKVAGEKPLIVLKTILPPDPMLVEMAKQSDCERVDVGSGWELINVPPADKFDFRTFDLCGPPSSRGADIILTALQRCQDSPVISGDELDVILGMQGVDWVDWQYRFEFARVLNVIEQRILRQGLYNMLDEVPRCPEHAIIEGAAWDLLALMLEISRCPLCRQIGGLALYDNT